MDTTPANDDEMHGHALFILHCADCHQAANPELLKQPPKLNGLFELKVLPSGSPDTDEQVRSTIIEAKGIMPPFDRRLTEQEVNDLLKYLHTLK